MPEENSSIHVSFNNLRIASISMNSGVFAGANMQYLWHSDSASVSGFGVLTGECNSMESPWSITTDPNSSDELLKYLEEQVRARIKKQGD